MDGDSTPRQYSLEELAQLSGISERTIRSYIYDELLPEPLGRGRATSYTQEHLEKLQFIIAVRKATPYELPLSLVRQLLQSLSHEQVARIARGEEAVHASQGAAGASRGPLDQHGCDAGCAFVHAGWRRSHTTAVGVLGAALAALDARGSTDLTDAPR
jgi:DNA-binding transcriptional MerR regulator